MLLLFNKTIKPLNQFPKKNPKEASLFGATVDNFLYQFWQNILPISFSVTHKFLWTLDLSQISEKGTTRFGFIWQAVDKNGSEIYEEKFLM